MEENVGLKILPAEHQEMVEHLEQIHGLRISFAAWSRATHYLRKKTPEGNNEGFPPLRGMKDLLNDACNVLIHDSEEAVTEAENLLSRSLVYYSELVREKGRQSRLRCSYLLKELNYLEVKLLKSIDFSPPIIPASDALPPNSKDMISCCQKLVTALKLRQCDDVPSLLKEFDGCLQMFHIRLFKKLSKFCTLGIKHVDKVQSRVSGIPAPWLKRSLESKDITTFRRQLRAMVQGHDSVIDKIANALFSPVLASKGHRPWTFLFLGQSGTGMGQMAKAISTHLFCSQLIKLDMFEATLEKLMDSVRNKPYCLLHLKSFEKVSSSLMDSIITILTHGKLTDEGGSIVDFTKTMIIMTSNVGAHQLDIGCPLYSRNSKHSNNEHVCSTSCSAPERVLREAKKTFDSVMLNHLDGIHVFSKTYYSEEFVIGYIMREMTMLVTNNPIAIYPSECALNAVLSSVRSSTPNPSCRNRHALKEWLFENVYPAVESNYVNCNYKGLSAVYIDTLVGTNELCYRKELHGTLLEEFFLKKYSMSWRKLKATHMGEREAYKKVVTLREKCSNHVVCIQIDEMAGYNQDFIRLLESFLQTLHSMLDISNESLPKQVSCRQLDEEELRVLGRKSGYRLRGHNLALDIIMEAIFRSTKATTDLPLQPASTLLLLGFDSDCIMQIMEGLLKELSFTRTLSVIHIDMSEDDFETRLFKASSHSAGGIGSVLPSIIDAVEAWPHCVIFFDKVEKAAPSDYSYLLRILDTGVLDSRGYMVDFRRVVIILNSDLGRKERIADIFSGPSLKATTGDVQQGEESRFRSELIGRVDEVVMANPSSSGREIARVDLKSDQLLRRSSLPTGVSFFFNYLLEKNPRSRRLGKFIEVLKFDLSVQIVKRPPLFLP